LFVLTLIIISITSIFILINVSKPPNDGELIINQILDSVSIKKDQWGIPHIEAKNQHDALFAYGYTVAKDRLFQMDLQRRLARGELSEIMGEDLLEIDKMFRSYLIAHKAKQYISGPQKFLIYYISCALGASILHLGVTYFRIQSIETGLSLEDLELFRTNAFEAFQKGMNFKDPILAQLNILHNSPMLGASGAIFGLLAAFGYLFPNTELMLLFPPIPIKAKYFVIGYAVLELYLGISNNPSDNVAHFAHLGGALIGIIIVLYWSKKRNSFF